MRKSARSDPIRIELYAIGEGWMARIEDLEDYEAGPYPTAYEPLEEVGKLIRQFYEAFAFLKGE